MPDTVLIVPLDDDLAAAFAEAAKAADLSEAELVRALVQEFVDHGAVPEPEDQAAYDAWFIEKVDEGIAAARAGQIIPHEDVSRYFDALREDTRRKLTADGK